MKTTIILFVFIAIAMITKAQYMITSVPSPTITVQPGQNQILQEGETLDLVIIASGAKKYQWYKNGISIPEATSPIYKVFSVSVSDGGTYYCAVYNGDCQSISNTALVTVKPAPKVSITASEGQFGTLTLKANCSSSCTYQWFKDGIMISGATSKVYICNTPQVGRYTVEVTNYSGVSSSTSYTIK